MSCGNRFQCGLKKATRFSFQPDKPSNPELYNENQKRLNDLLKAREEMDKTYSSNTPTNALSNSPSIPSTNELIQKNTLLMPQDETQLFTPWKVPSTQDFNYKLK
jgi:hypothetical protein